MEINLRRNKKAALSDGIFYIIALFVIAIIFIFSWKILSDINNEFQSSDYISANGKTLIQESANNYAATFNNAYLIIFIGLIIAIVVGAFFIRTHPALFWITIPIMAFIIWLGAIYSNIFHVIEDSAEIAPYAAAFPFISFIFDNYVYFITGVVLLIAFALFSKNVFNNEQ